MPICAVWAVSPLSRIPQSLRYKWLDLMKDTYGSYLVRDVLAIVGGHLDIRALHNPAAGGASGADGKPVVCRSSPLSICNHCFSLDPFLVFHLENALCRIK